MTSETNKHPKIEQLKPSLLFRNTRRVLNNPIAFLGDVATQYGPVVRINIAGKKYLILQDPEFIKHVLSDNHRGYNKFGITKILRVFFGEGLVTSNGEMWIKKRRLIQPAFHIERISHILNIINTETHDFIKTLNKLPSGSEVNISREMLRLNVSIVNKALFSNNDKKDMQAMMLILEDLTNFATKWMKSIIKIPLNWSTPSNIKFRKNCREYDSIIYAMIDRRRRYKKEHIGHPHNDLLDMLLDDVDEDTQNEMTDKQVRDDITTMFMAGHDTTAQTLSWICYEIAKNKEISNKLHQEVKDIVQDKSLKLENLSQFDYTNKVIKEGMRRYPSISAVQRRPIEDDVFKGITFKKSNHLLINIYGMHHNSNYWETPELFDPERFTQEAEKQRPPFVYLPFGGGPRRCIGSNFAMMVMQVIVSSVFKNFEFEVPKGYLPVIVPNITIKPKNGIPLIIHKR
jgi:cytochrome P450